VDLHCANTATDYNEEMGLTVLYNCIRCPSYCCSYPRIPVQPEDVQRLALHFGLTVEAAVRKFTRKSEEPGEIVLKHTPDPVYGTACRFLDRKTRRCSIYEARPGICHEYPGNRRCGYYDFLAFERRVQGDPEFIPSTYNRPKI
jgi:Fe-S-cluster containining protein